MLRIFLVRHGETEANKIGRYQGITEYPLSETGRKQARDVARDLQSIDFSLIFSSPLSRAKETAAIIAPEKEISIIPEFIERDFGCWENLPYVEIKKNYPELYSAWLKQPDKTIIPDALSLQDHQEMILEGLWRVEQKHSPEKDENFLIAGHGGTNRLILLHYLNLDLSSFWKIKQDNCCVNIIEIDKTKEYTSVSLLNYTKDVYQAKRYRY